MYLVDVSWVEPDWMARLGGYVLECQEVVGQLWRAWHLRGPLKAQYQQVHDQAVVLHDERGELQAADDAVRVSVVHVLK